VSEKPGGLGSDFDAAAERVTAPSPSPEETQVAQPVASEVAAPSAPAQPFIIRREWANKAVQFCFVPLANVKKDARWLVTPQEAEIAEGPMQEVLQQLVDKYLPANVSLLLSKYEAVGALFVALLALYKMKAEQIAKAGPQSVPKRTAAPGEIPPAPEEVSPAPEAFA
jgi:hypothetical protein